jgi:hypothetical protein
MNKQQRLTELSDREIQEKILGNIVESRKKLEIISGLLIALTALFVLGGIILMSS